MIPVSPEGGADELRDRARRMVDRYGPCGAVVCDAAEVLALADAAAELRTLRLLLAGLPDDDWQPIDWAALSLAQEDARTALFGADNNGENP